MILIEDKVKIVKNLSDHEGYKKGQIVEVIGADDDGYFHVEGADGTQWYVGEEEIEVVKKGSGKHEAEIVKQLAKVKKNVKYAKGSTVKSVGGFEIGEKVKWNNSYSNISKQNKVGQVIGSEKNQPVVKWEDGKVSVVSALVIDKYDNGGGVGVSSKITADNNAIGTGADLNFNQYGGGGKISSSDEGTGSQDLKEKAQAKIDKGLTVIHFGYTDYGGTFGDRVAIAYFKKHHPKNILWENSGYNGENAFVFGKVADEYLEETAKYPLGYEDIEDFYYEMQNKQEEKDYKDFVKDLKRTYKVSPNTLSWLMENKSGYYQLEPNMLDFSYEELTKELIEEGLVKAKKMDNGGGVGVSSDITADNNGIGTGADLNFSQYAKGSTLPSHDRMYNFLKDDLAKLESSYSALDYTEINRFFSYWDTHLKSLKTKTNERMYNFLKDDLEKLVIAMNDDNNEEVDRFFSYWGTHLESLKMAKGGNAPSTWEYSIGGL